MVCVRVFKDVCVKVIVLILLLVLDCGSIKEFLVVKGFWIKWMGDEILEGVVVFLF